MVDLPGAVNFIFSWTSVFILVRGVVCRGEEPERHVPELAAPVAPLADDPSMVLASTAERAAGVADGPSTPSVATLRHRLPDGAHDIA